MLAVLLLLENHLRRGLITLVIEILVGVVIYVAMLLILQDKAMKSIAKTVINKIHG